MENIRAQGATEYLILLAVVLIVALMSVALLGFFPGMASDAQITQSQMYWQSATPIAIIEWGAALQASSLSVYPYIKLRNTGAYPIRIIGIIGADGATATTFYTTSNVACIPATVGTYNISDYYYIASGEEAYFVYTTVHGGNYCNRRIISRAASSSGSIVGGAASVCQNSTTSPGTLNYPTFGFEYIAYIDGQQITKRQIGKDFIVKCMPPA